MVAAVTLCPLLSDECLYQPTVTGCLICFFPTCYAEYVGLYGAKAENCIKRITVVIF